MHKYITTDPTESEDYPGFYYTPVADTIVVSPYGEFIALDDGRKLNVNPITEKTPYPALWIPGLGGRSVWRKKGTWRHYRIEYIKEEDKST